MLRDVRAWRPGCQIPEHSLAQILNSLALHTALCQRWPRQGVWEEVREEAQEAAGELGWRCWRTTTHLLGEGVNQGRDVWPEVVQQVSRDWCLNKTFR